MCVRACARALPSIRTHVFKCVFVCVRMRFFFFSSLKLSCMRARLHKTRAHACVNVLVRSKREWMGGRGYTACVCSYHKQDTTLHGWTFLRLRADGGGGGGAEGWGEGSVLLSCLSSQQHASVSEGWICSDICHTEIEVADQTYYLTHSTLTPGQRVPALTLYRQAPGRGHW